MELDDLLTAAEVADLLGVQRRSVYHMRRYLKGFPQPVHDRSRSPLWDRRDVEGWRAAHPARFPKS